MLVSAIIIISVFYFINILCAFQVRFKNGITLAELIRSKFYEIFPLRALFWIIFYCLGFKFLQSIVVTLINSYRININLFKPLLLSSTGLVGILFIFYYRILIIRTNQILKINTKEVKISYRLLLKALFGIIFAFLSFNFIQSLRETLINGSISDLNFLKSLLFTIGLAGILWIFYDKILIIRNNQISKVNTKRVKIRYGIDQSLLKDLGSEKFPNEALPNNYRENTQRKIIAFIGICCFVFCLFFLFNRHYLLEFNLLLLEKQFLYKLFELIPTSIISCAIVILLLNNRNYSFIPFQKNLKVQLYLWITLIISLFLYY